MVSSSQLLLRSCCSFVTRRGLTLLSWAASLVLAALQISHGTGTTSKSPECSLSVSSPHFSTSTSTTYYELCSNVSKQRANRCGSVICDLSTSPTVDLAGARMFLDLYTELGKRQINLRLVEAHASVRDLLRLEGAEDRVGRIDRFATVDDVIEHFLKGGA